MSDFDQRAAWNRVAHRYQKNRQISTTDAHYGPWSPDEGELRLLGNVAGKRILELGCGGGESSIAFAKQGADVSAIDLSDEQIAFAQRLAQKEKITVDFHQGMAENLAIFADDRFDIVFSTYLFHYIANIQHCLDECWRVLKAGGQLIFCLDHPIRDCFYDEEMQEDAIYPVRSYFNNRPLSWPFHDGEPMRSYHFTIAQWIDMIHVAGFHLVRLMEPEPHADLLTELWTDDDPFASRKNIPQTVIFVVAKKRPPTER